SVRGILDEGAVARSPTSLIKMRTCCTRPASTRSSSHTGFSAGGEWPSQSIGKRRHEERRRRAIAAAVAYEYRDRHERVRYGPFMCEPSRFLGGRAPVEIRISIAPRSRVIARGV